MKKILIAEDDQFLASAYRVKLTKEGFDVKIAGDGEEAIEMLKTFTPDLIVLDIVMPKKDGFTTLQEIRSNPMWKNLPILIASSLGQQEDVKKGLSLGATDYIIKSDVALGDIVKKINELTP